MGAEAISSIQVGGSDVSGEGSCLVRVRNARAGDYTSWVGVSRDFEIGSDATRFEGADAHRVVVHSA